MSTGVLSKFEVERFFSLDVLGVVEVDVVTGTIIRANERFLQRAKLAQSTSDSQSFTLLLSEPCRNHFEYMLRDAAAQNMCRVNYASLVLDIDGQRIEYTTNTFLIAGVGGQSSSLLLLLEEVIFREAIAGGNERKTEFLAMLSHELRNPLAALAAACRLLKTGQQKGVHQLWPHQAIDRQLKQLSSIMDELLDVSRINQGHIRIETERVDLCTLIDHALSMVKTDIEIGGHQVFWNGGESPFLVDVDPLRIEQVLVNLLTNACKYSHKNGVIEIELRRQAEDCCLSIKDQGVGISPELLPDIFELFSQADRSLARTEGGLGIGLTVVKKIVDMHGGSIEARSEGEGKGSEFMMWLPAFTTPTREPSSNV